ncbi:metal-dependent hydrolase [Kaistia sp. 32K]|uniref:M48 family metallopeptidase n=1 Tax=Kaistia sp. 32K TaxID=2795690 RepID=UPI001915EF10|nr:SprT family zinc-dependent metalloprotease [Kaistia sp. 32K]BCP55957.1 metal-dependent hydrolase [Kaistia sp. 32K]
MGFLSRLTPSPKRAALAKPDHCHVEIDGEPVRVTLVWNDRARRYTLRLRGSVREPVVTIPARGKLAEAQDFIERHSGWLRSRLAALPDAKPIEDGGVIPLRGVPVRIVHREGRGLVRLEPADGETLLVVTGGAEHIARRVTDFLKREARRDLEEATARHAASLGVKVKAIRLGDPTSRWGSCSSSGTIAYSWRMIMAPPAILDYLAAHEVAHLREMNHSDRFWRHVATICPHMEQAKSWLNRHGASLHAVGAEG